MVAKPSPDPMSSMWSWLAHDLRLYRMRAKMTQDDLGRVLGCVKSTVSRLEGAQLQIDEKQAAKLDTLWNTYGHFARLLAFARRANDPDWIKQHAEFEAKATEIKTFEALLIPGLLQTREYARQVFTSGSDVDDVDELLEARMLRQEALTRPKPPRLWVLLDEGVINRPAGCPEVMRDQLARLLEESKRPNVSVRVVPRSCGLHAGLGGSFKILYHELGDVAYSEAQFGGRLVVSNTEVRGLTVRYDRIGAHALPEGPSRDLIEQNMEAIS
ncbi:MAG: transcriptional regulator, family [Actinoallomurus sp.]|jgi:transcriptional regulator with XRE-family HTH domain|nr:transcriptional regulator, family [Actinoallomurus sp.]